MTLGSSPHARLNQPPQIAWTVEGGGGVAIKAERVCWLILLTIHEVLAAALSPSRWDRRSQQCMVLESLKFKWDISRCGHIYTGVGCVGVAGVDHFNRYFWVYVHVRILRRESPTRGKVGWLSAHRLEDE